MAIPVILSRLQKKDMEWRAVSDGTFFVVTKRRFGVSVVTKRRFGVSIVLVGIPRCRRKCRDLLLQSSHLCVNIPLLPSRLVSWYVGMLRVL